MIQVVPAYGRKYKRAGEAKAAFLSGIDFILKDISSRWHNKPCSCRDFKGQTVFVHFGEFLEKMVKIEVPK